MSEYEAEMNAGLLECLISNAVERSRVLPNNLDNTPRPYCHDPRSTGIVVPDSGRVFLVSPGGWKRTQSLCVLATVTYQTINA